MSYIINAWLESNEPSVTVVSSLTGQELVNLKADRVRELIETGELDVDELQKPRRDLVELVKELMTIARQP